MSPRRFDEPASQAAVDGERRIWVSAGLAVRAARLAKRWSVAELAARAGVSRAVAYHVESGQPTSLEALVRSATALGLRLDVDLTDPRRRAEERSLSRDVVHSAMGEFEAARLRSAGVRVGLDEPYQHFQFAGRADLVAWDVERRALLHVENRTRFPDFQEMAGGFNAKRAYLGPAIAARVGVNRWASETHVIAALWSSEVLHALRLRTESFRALCPDDERAFHEWWSGGRAVEGRTSILIVLDPRASGRERPFVGLEVALGARPRYRSYADAVARLDRAA